jgi:hypothetical protein
METSNKISDTKKSIPIFGKRKSKEKGYMNFENSETQKSFFEQKEKIDEEIEEKAFWAGLLGFAVLGLIFTGSILLYGVHGINELWKGFIKFFRF